MSDDQLRRFLLRSASAVMALALAYAAARYLLVWLLPFLLAAATAAAMEPAVRFLQRRLRFRRSFAAAVLTLFLLFLLGGFLSLAGSTLVREAYALLDGLPALLKPEALESLLDRLWSQCAFCPPWLRQAVEDRLRHYFQEAGSVFRLIYQKSLSVLSQIVTALPRFFLFLATYVLACAFTSSSWPLIRAFLRKNLSNQQKNQLILFYRAFVESMLHWLRAELKLCAVTFAELLAGFLLLGQPYALLPALVITLVDALPVFGTGTVLLPWAAAELLLGSVPKGAMLLGLYLVILTVRSALEPKLLGDAAGLPPIASLLAMYLGFCAFGVAGMISFPFLLLCALRIAPAVKEGRAVSPAK